MAEHPFPTHDPERDAAGRGLALIDYADFLVARKLQLLKVFLVSLVVTYLAIFLFIDEQFEATALIIPREEDVSTSAGNLLRGLKGLPLGLGPKSTGSEMDLYTTIIYSRVMMEDVIRKFNLLDLYGLDTSSLDHMEKAVKRLRKDVVTKETEESAFQVTVRAGTRVMAADMTNYIVQRMNDKIIELKFSRSRDNRVFLEQRIAEVSAQLKAAEDSLQAFQERTGMLDAKVQLQGILTANATLETELTAKKFKKSILERLYDKESPEVRDLDVQIQEYQRNLNQLRAKGDPGSPMLPLKNLPKTTVEYVRRYREVELNNLLMEYVLPLYEQAKIEEKKDIPILQVIDHAVPPAKKSYPPRTLFALIGAFTVTFLAYVALFVRERAGGTTDTRLRSLFHEAMQWDWKGRKRAG